MAHKATDLIGRIISATFPAATVPADGVRGRFVYRDNEMSKEYTAILCGCQGQFSRFPVPLRCHVTAVVFCDEGAEPLLVVTIGDVKLYQHNISALFPAECNRRHFRIFCEHEKSCGIIVWRVYNGQPQLLMLQQRGARSWSFPKGHMEIGESEEETAIRELREETGMCLTPMPDCRYEIQYRVNAYTTKTVVLFLAHSGTEVCRAQNEEILRAVWMHPTHAKRLFPHCSRTSSVIDEATELICRKRSLTLSSPTRRKA